LLLARASAEEVGDFGNREPSQFKILNRSCKEDILDAFWNSAVSRASAMPGEGASQTYPLGPTLTSDGANFSVFSAHATQVEIVFFEHADAQRPARGIKLNPITNRTSHYWHIFVPGIVAGQLYGFRVDGPGAVSYTHLDVYKRQG